MEDIMVSVICLTYNHKEYIEDAIKGFVSQKVNFKFEVIIHDDASNDGTAEIIRKYEAMYPTLIKAIYQTENQYSQGNDVTKIAEQKCSGKYIAWCEGDDFWIDKNKLQLQVDYMESHPDCFMTAHDALRFDCRDGGMKTWNPYEKDGDLTSEDIILRWGIPTASTVYKKEVIEMADFFLDVGVGDFPMALYALSKGKIHYFTRIMSVYRYMHEGSWSCSQNRSLYRTFLTRFNFIILLEKYNDYTYGKYKEVLEDAIAMYVCACSEIAEEIKHDEFKELCETYMKKGQERMKYIKLIESVRDKFCLTKECDADIKCFVPKYKYICIYGAGKYAGIIAKKMNYSDIEVSGYIISDDQYAEKEYLGKPIWKLKEIPFKKNEVGIIVAVNRRLWKEIKPILDEKKLEYIYPLETEKILHQQ